MLIKLNSSLQTRNYLGLSDEDLASAVTDPYFNYIRLGDGFSVDSEKSGNIITLIGREMNIHRDYLAIVQPNPILHRLGSVSFNPLLGGVIKPTFTLKSYKKFEEIELDYLYEVRLLK
jgi:hypothetical protein